LKYLFLFLLIGPLTSILKGNFKAASRFLFKLFLMFAMSQCIKWLNLKRRAAYYLKWILKGLTDRYRVSSIPESWDLRGCVEFSPDGLTDYKSQFLVWTPSRLTLYCVTYIYNLLCVLYEHTHTLFVHFYTHISVYLHIGIIQCHSVVLYTTYTQHVCNTYTYICVSYTHILRCLHTLFIHISQVIYNYTSNIPWYDDVVYLYTYIRGVITDMSDVSYVHHIHSFTYCFLGLSVTFINYLISYHPCRYPTLVPYCPTLGSNGHVTVGCRGDFTRTQPRMFIFNRYFGFFTIVTVSFSSDVPMVVNRCIIHVCLSTHIDLHI
jgi:hypothetical protein